MKEAESGEGTSWLSTITDEGTAASGAATAEGGAMPP